jgi:raffinose/stachyose/melibiose transport system substrate-binding protein
MKLRSVLNGIGFSLLAAAFIVSLWRVSTRSAEEARGDIIRIRFAHWQLEAGIEDGFNQLAREYERLHPNVRIEQLRIPERIYANWITTQLVGGTAPDLIQLGGGQFGMTTDRQARYFIPLGDLVDRPNPYNEGTELEGVPWRNTFVDGMEGAFSDDLYDYYGATIFVATVRVYYNREMMREITGSDQPPATYDDFIALCERVQQWAAERNRLVVPIAGTRYNAPYMLEDLFRSQTQRLTFETQNSRRWVQDTEEGFARLLRGDYSLRDPAMSAAFNLMGSFGRFMPPGFMQLGREDGTFYFVQGRALMISTGSWDVASLASQAPFEIGVFRFPLPMPDHPRYGQQTLGRLSEGALRSYGPLGLYRGSRHPEQAMDFLQFITSQPANRTFAKESGWLPVVVGVEPSGLAKAFMPDLEGIPPGFTYRWGSDTQRVIDNNLHHLFGRRGADAFIEAVEHALPDAIRADLRRGSRNRGNNLARNDSVFEALRRQAMAGEDPTAARKLEILIEAQNAQEIEFYRRRTEVEP